jgi:hypothetical protein
MQLSACKPSVPDPFDGLWLNRARQYQLNARAMAALCIWRILNVRSDAMRAEDTIGGCL